MAIVVGVRFKEAGKVYNFDPIGLDFELGEKVVVETARGIECGEVVAEPADVPESEIVKPLKKIIRKATKEDIAKLEENKKKEAEALEICEKKIEKHGLGMKLVDVEYTLDGSKILFYFTADGRVDFRELVKDLAGVFHTRIELRQIGVRDEAKMLGGLGICGRPFCCSTYIDDLQSVSISIKMAKEQGLSLNPTKISGTCGRLMCCLKYEQESYEHLLRVTPKVGALVNTREGKGVVSDVNLLTGMLKVTLDRNPNAAPISVHRHDVNVIKDTKIKVEKAELEALKGIE